MTSKIFVLTLAAATALSLTACKKTGEPHKGTSDDTVTVDAVSANNGTTTTKSAADVGVQHPEYPSTHENAAKSMPQENKDDNAAEIPVTTPAPADANASAAPAAAAAAAGAGAEVKLPGGTTYVDEVVGTGPEAHTGQTVTVHYTGTLTNGEKFDSSHDRNRPFTFSLGAGDVIKGWDEGIVGMKVGGKRKLVIPADQAYGSEQKGPIPPNSTLLFDVELLGVQ